MRKLTNEKNYNCLNYGYIINNTNSDNGGECYPDRYNNRAFGTEY